MAIARNTQRKKQFDRRKLFNQPTPTKTIPPKLPAVVQSLDTKDGQILPNQLTPTKNIPSKLPAVVQDFSGEGEISVSEPAVEKDSVREASSIPSEAASISLENDFAATFNGDQSERVAIPPDYKVHNVPGDGLCGYWATLAAQRAEEADDGTSVRVEKKDVFELLGQLADRIAYTIKKEDKTDRELEMVDEIDQLLRDGYAKDYEDLYQRIEKGQMQLDSPLAVFLAQVIGYNIIVEWEGIKSGKNVHVQERYQTNDAQGTVIIYYSGNGSGGHYQAIISRKINVVFN
jgi:hypothetical protein